MALAAERVRSRHPFEILFLGIAIATSISSILTREVHPNSLAQGVGYTGTVIWAVILFVGAVVAVVGIFLPDRATGLIMEALGLFVTGLCTLFYAAAAFVVLGIVALYPAGTLVGYGTAAILRAAQIRKILVKVARASAARREG